MWSTWSGAGSGVRAADVERIRDMFLEQRAQAEHGEQSRLDTQQTTFSRLEQLFDEPGDLGLAQAFGDFWNSWHDLANAPGDMAARKQVLQRASAVTDTLNGAYTQVATEWSGARDQLSALAHEVNATAASVAQLNGTIAAAVQSGVPANELMDKRDQLVMRLSDLVGATSRSGDSGTVDVYLGGTSLVRGNIYDTLNVTGPSDFQSLGSGSVSLEWATGAFKAETPSGQAGGLLTTLNDTLPRYVSRLDEVTNALVTQVNTAHAAGYDLNGAAGQPLFDPAGTTAQNVRVVLFDASLVAASGTPSLDGSGNPVGNLDGSNADLLGKIATQTGSPDKVYRAMIVDLGVESQGVTRRAEVQASVVGQADADRESQSGVNLDEEMVNMLAFQRAYEAAARLMSTVDSTLETLINMAR